MVTALLVAARIVANPVSNLFQKQLTARAVHPIAVIAVTHFLLSLIAVPLLAFPSFRAIGPGFWPNLVGCAVLAVASNVLLVYALRSADLSILGPVNAYKAVISLALGTVVLGEFPTAWGLAGVGLILLGSYGVTDREPGAGRSGGFGRFFAQRGVQLRLAALLLSATEAVFLKRTLQSSAPGATFVAWCMVGLPLAMTAGWIALRIGGTSIPGQMVALREHRGTCCWLALTTGVMQATTLFTFDRLPVGYSLALFQTSSLISVLLGHRFLREGHVGRRITGSLVMIAGAVLIVLRGRAGQG